MLELGEKAPRLWLMSCVDAVLVFMEKDLEKFINWERKEKREVEGRENEDLTCLKEGGVLFEIGNVESETLKNGV